MYLPSKVVIDVSEDAEYVSFCHKIKDFLQIDLLEYKENQMKRRLKSLYEKRGFSDFQTYYKHIVADESIRLEFLDRITINVSEFFRNYPRWQVLEKDILPQLLKENRPLKVWSAACSSGEEPYTLAMILSRFLPLERIQILATDIDEKILAKAKSGVYNEYAIKGCPEAYFKKFFTQKDGQYVISNDIKSCVTFKKQNLLNDMFDTNYDLIVCRNVMIYFTEDAKEKLYRKFSAALKENGIFFVGSTEQIFQPQNYSFVTEKTFFYKKER